MTVKITSEGYLITGFVPANGYLVEADEEGTEMEVDEETYGQIMMGKFCHRWKYTDGTWELVCVDEDNWLRRQRRHKCFDILDNKSQMWYNCLTDEQNTELKEWYQAWLNVTDTKVMPETPEWLS